MPLVPEHSAVRGTRVHPSARRAGAQTGATAVPPESAAGWAAVHGVAEGRTQLSDFTFTFHFHALEKEMATHSSVLARRIPEMGEPGGLPSMGCTELDTTE